MLAILAAAVIGVQQTPDKVKFEAADVLRRFYGLMHEAPTATGLIRSRAGREESQIRFRIMRPNLFSLIGSDFEVKGNGKTMTMRARGRSEPIRFRQSETSPDIYGFEALTTDVVPAYVKANRVHPSHFRGRAAYSIPIVDDRTQGTSGVTLYIDRDSLLPLGCMFHGKEGEDVLAYEAVQLGVPMERNEFEA